jgi:hypothetical protein
MSAFIVADKTINHIVNWLRSEKFLCPEIPDKFKALGIDRAVSGWEAKLGRAMFQLNIRAVDARYGSGQAAKIRKRAYRYHVAEVAPLVQVLQSLHCWLYQCDEGVVPATELYRLFATDVQIYLMDTIITNLPEYEKAKWG